MVLEEVPYGLAPPILLMATSPSMQTEQRHAFKTAFLETTSEFQPYKNGAKDVVLVVRRTLEVE